MLHNNGQTADGQPVRMSGVHRTFLVLVLILTVIPGWRLLATLPSQGLTMEQVIPAEAQPGSVVTVTGYALDPAHIREIYLLTDGHAAYRVEILSEAGTSLRFLVPLNAPSGTMRIAVRAPDKAGLLEQMVELKIVESRG